MLLAIRISFLSIPRYFFDLAEMYTVSSFLFGHPHCFKSSSYSYFRAMVSGSSSSFSWYSNGVYFIEYVIVGLELSFNSPSVFVHDPDLILELGWEMSDYMQNDIVHSLTSSSVDLNDSTMWRSLRIKPHSVRQQ